MDPNTPANGDDRTDERPPVSPPRDPCTSSYSGSVESSDALARWISSVLGSVIRDFDRSAEGAVQSQDELSIALDRLTGELDKLLEDAPLPFIMQYATKISGVRKRVMSLNLLLRSIQRRIDNMDRMLSAGLACENSETNIERPPQH
ncbi:hypothetical protein QJS04_geneDACA020323 [Acorus gramineus]|uniref:Biogenesis of lysosome-related organelles complex 1 subunit 7 n=1 Tax=Acorus gramineus TaxID=55184 RepID=A0AAV9A7L7_ACOGR|nr:hypothetical protein QJS04_geneDACA020323 [Acorus gramineus]